MPFDTYARRQAKVLFEALADRLVKDLSNAAKEEAEAAAAAARQEAEGRARAELASARADGEARLAAAQAMNAGLLESVEAAREDVRATQAAAKADVERTRLDLEGRLDHLKQERAQIVLARDEAGKRLDAETRRAAEIGAQLEKETKRASELDARLQKESRRASDLASRMDAETKRANELDTHLIAETRRAGKLGEALEEARKSGYAVLDRMSAALSSVDRATSPSQIFEVLLDPLANDFAVAAVFLVGPSSVVGWRARGLDPGTDITKLVFRRTDDALLVRAVADRKPVFAAAADTASLTGLLGGPVARAAAFPVFAGDQVIAVAYAEDAEKGAAPFPGAGCRIAEALIHHATLRIAVKRPPQHAPAAPAPYTPARQARRLKPSNSVDVTVDGAESSLVDVSSVGAQILSSVAVRPNKVLRMMLRAGERAMACKGRVMWARFEQARGTAAAHYRVGLKFTDVDPKTMEAFLKGKHVVEATR